MRKLISLNENWTLSFPKGERLAEKVTYHTLGMQVDGMDGQRQLSAHYRCVSLHIS